MLVTHPLRCKHYGFTLIELLVAMAVFALLMVIAVTGLQQLMTTAAVQKEHETRLRARQITYLRLARDLVQAVNRPVRVSQSVQSAFIGHAFNDTRLVSSDNRSRVLLELTRAGRPNPGFAAKRSNLLRVRYRVQADELWRDTWPTIDRAQGVTPNTTRLMTQIQSITVTYYDKYLTEKASWLLLNAESGVTQRGDFEGQLQLPVAVQFTIVTRQTDERWLFLTKAERHIAEKKP